MLSGELIIELRTLLELISLPSFVCVCVCVYVYVHACVRTCLQCSRRLFTILALAYAGPQGQSKVWNYSLLTFWGMCTLTCFGPSRFPEISQNSL